MTDFSFSPKNVDNAIQNKIAIQQLPQWAQGTEQIQKYFNDAIQHWFTPEQQKRIDGYIGQKHGMDSTQKTFIEEMSLQRNEYQLQPSFVSVDATNKILAALSYPDLIDNLKFNGALTENNSRLLNGRTYCWAPPINPDMLINFSNYYWDTKNIDGLVEPEYIVMERGAADGNLWSAFNHWHPSVYNDENGNTIRMTPEMLNSGDVIPARRPIIEFKKNIELVDFGRTSRGEVDYLCDDLLPADIMFRTIADGIKVDNFYIKNGDRILFTNISNPGENNRIYKVTTKLVNSSEVYGLVLDSSEMSTMRPTGEPLVDDVLRIKSGLKYKNVVLYWNGAEWVKGQQKTIRNQAPLFNLYDKSKTVLNDKTKYLNSTFTGSKLFSYKINQKNSEDSVIGYSIDREDNGDIIFENYFNTNDISYIKDGTATTMSGMKFYRVISTAWDTDQYFSDWKTSPELSMQYVTQTINPEVHQKTFTIAMTVGENNSNINYPLIEVDVNGELLNSTNKTSWDQLNPGEYFVQGNELTVNYTFTDNSIMGVKVYNAHQTPLSDMGVYEIPKNLQNNANNANIDTIKEAELAKHFFDIISAQTGFIGSPFGYNNYVDTLKDMSIGREILQHDASLIPLMVHNCDNKLDIIKAIELAKGSYNSFRNKFNQKLNEINNTQNVNSPRGIMIDIINSINIGKSDEFAFWLSGMATSNDLPKSFIAPTPQYLGILGAYEPKIRTKIAGFEGLFNISHTGSITRAYSSLEIDDGVETVIKDFRDMVILEIETAIFESLDVKFKNSDYIPMLSIFDVKPNLFRTTEYSMQEWNKIALRSFEQWVINNKIDYRTNHDFNSNDWKTWNYSSCSYSLGGDSRGNWKAIYMDHFDTYEPNTKPWEMLGFTIKPQWWDATYTSVTTNGVKYYNDATLWDAIEVGYIANGSRKGIDKRFARQGFKNINPIGADGQVVAPYLSQPGRTALLTFEPSINNIDDAWKFGDLGSIEFGYFSSNFYAFDLAASLYRAKPAQWANYFWNTTDYSRINLLGEIQWLNDSTDTRIQFNSSTIVHGELNTRVIGYQMWVSDLLKHSHTDIGTYYGNIVRGSTVKLMYRLGGFSKKENLSFVSDSFGLLSQENQQVKLIKSAVRTQETLSAIKVAYTKDGYIISGFDGTNPYLNYFKCKTNAARYSLDIGSTKLIHYEKFETTASEIGYDTIFRTIQEVYEFVIGYGAWLESKGWIFEDLTETNEVFDWNYIARLFVDWANGKHANGDYISLSPSSTSCKFAAPHGYIDNVAQFSGGAWTLVDTSGNGIGTHDIGVSRIGNIIHVSLVTAKQIGLIRLNVVEFEHAVIFDNTTIFGDVVYLPILGLHQLRLKTYSTITDGWTGRLEAPGFMVVDNSIIPNFEKLVNDFERYYDNENPSSSIALNDLSRHVIGFQSRSYLKNLILNSRNQIDFYKGFIKEKGTVQAFKKILRTAKNLNTKDYKLLEEWAFKVGEYGDTNNEKHLEFILNSNAFKQDPQLFTFDANLSADDGTDNVITYFGTENVDSRWMTRNDVNKFPMVNKLKIAFDFPTSGPITLDEVDIVSVDFSACKADRSSYIKNTGKVPTSVWITNDSGDWNVYDIVKTNLKVIQISDMDDSSCIVHLNANHQLMDSDVVFMYAEDSLISGLNEETFYQELPSLNSNEILFNTKLTSKVYDPLDTRLPVLYKYVPRYTTEQKTNIINSRVASIPNNASFVKPVIYNKVTNTTDTYLTLWDPLVGVVPGIVDAEITYKTQMDPAKYNNVDASTPAWGSERVGEVWWDTSTARYIDYHQCILNSDNSVNTNRTLSYRREHWGKLLPGSTVDIYEWVKSPVSPINWDEYVVSQSTNNKEQGSWLPSGTANIDFWSEIKEYNHNSNDYKVYYYFWVKDSIYVPTTENRTRSISSISKIIESPSSLDIPWFAAINENSFIVSGVSPLITDNQSVLQLRYLSSADEIKPKHVQWQLLQEGNDYKVHDELWNSLCNSLIGERYDAFTDDKVPLLYPSTPVGCGFGNTWFMDILSARREFVSSCNEYFRNVNIINGTSWSSILNYNETTSNKFMRGFTVTSLNDEMVLLITNPYRFNDGDSVYFSTDGALPEPLYKPIMYYLYRVPGQSQYFRIKESSISSDYVSLTTKGLGSCFVVRSKDIALDDVVTINVRDFWETTDWYSAGFDPTISTIEYESLLAAEADGLLVGDSVKIIDPITKKWTIYIREYSRDILVWTIVAQQDSTIQLNDKFYNNYSVYTNGDFSTSEKIVRSVIRKILSGFSDVQSRILFDMVHYVHNEQKIVDWVFKTSYISISGIDRDIMKNNTTKSVLDNIVEYFNEVKPYRTKIRSVIDQRTADVDTLRVGMFDDDVDPVNRALIEAELLKPVGTRNLSAIKNRFRESQEIVFFDQTTTEKEDTKDSEYYESLLNSLSQYDMNNRTPGSCAVKGCDYSTYNGTYIETESYPVFPKEFTLLGGNVLVDKSSKVYFNASANTYIWNQIGFGWILSKQNTETNWYYAASAVDILSTDIQSIKWFSAGAKPASMKDVNETAMSISVTPSKELNQYTLDRNANKFSTMDKVVIETFFEELNKVTPVGTDEFRNILLTFTTQQANGSLYFDFVKFMNLKATLGITSSILESIFIKSMDIYNRFKQYHNTANRLRINNPGASDEYVETIMDSAFKGVNILNKPRFAVPFGYSASTEESLNGYYLESDTIYRTIKRNLINSGKTIEEAEALLASYGYTVVPYVGYGPYEPRPYLNSLLVDKVQDLNSYAVDQNNPLTSYDGELMNGHVNDMNAFDNLGYNKATRSITEEELDTSQYLFDIANLMVESQDFAKFRATISNYQPTRLGDIDYGIYLSDGTIKPNSTKGTLNVNYDSFSSSDSGKFQWDFGRMYGDAFGSSFGSFSAEALVIRDPLNENRVVVSVPRTVEAFKTKWANSSIDFTSSEKYLHNFYVHGLMDQIAIGKHTFIDGDSVILFSNDIDVVPTGANFNDVTTLYTVKVVNSLVIELYQNGTRISLNSSDKILCSMLLVIKPSILNTVRIDYLNYDNYYGRFISGGELFKPLVGAVDTITLMDHNLKTADKVKLNSAISNINIGEANLFDSYFVHKVDGNSFKLMNTLADALKGTNAISLGTDIDKVSITVVNVWISSSVQKTVRPSSWFSAYDSLDFVAKLQMMKNQFQDGKVVSLPTDQLVEADFPRPNVDKGSLRELVRSRMDERLSITVFQDDRTITAANAKKYSTDGTLMYYDSSLGRAPFAFRFDHTSSDINMKVSRLAESETGHLVQALQWDSITAEVDFNPGTNPGSIEVNDETIYFSTCSPKINGSTTTYELGKLRRSYEGSAYGNTHNAGSIVKLLSSSKASTLRSISNVQVSPYVNASEYVLASNIFFDVGLDGKTTDLLSDTSDLATQLKENRASYANLK